jgi:hypothetical protein
MVRARPRLCRHARARSESICARERAQPMNLAEESRHRPRARVDAGFNCARWLR